MTTSQSNILDNFHKIAVISLNTMNDESYYIQTIVESLTFYTLILTTINFSSNLFLTG